LPYTIKRRADGGVIVEFKGVLTVEENQEARLAVVEGDYTNIAKVPYLIGDHSKVEKSTHSADDMRMLAQSMKVDVRAHNPDILIAIVAPKDLSFGLGRVFHAYLGGDKKTNLFRTRKEAEAWIAEMLEKK
jgi:hypothetical protein